MSDTNKRLQGIAFVTASALIWSFGGVLIRAIESADVWTVVFWRSLTAGIFLFGLVAWERRGKPLKAFAEMGWPGIGVACCFASASISLVVAIRLTSVADVLIIMSSAPILAAILGRIFLHERVSGLTALAIAATFGGIGMIVWQGLAERSATSLLGDAFAMLIAVSYATAIIITRRNHHIPMTPAVFSGVIIAGLISVPLAAPLAVTFHDAPYLLVLGVVQLGMGLAAFSAGARLIPAAHTALLGTLEPILGPLWVWLFMSEAPSTAALIGGAIVLAAITLHTLIETRSAMITAAASP